MGKTTCAAAAALAAAAAGETVLLVSTDPAHSLGDVLDLDLGPEPTPVPLSRGTLWAAEPAAEHSWAGWLTERRPLLQTLAERGTYLDAEDVDRLLALPMPGVDELVGLLALVRLGRRRRFRRVVVDTAPTAHTLRLLESPAALARLAALLGAMEDKHRVLAERLGGGPPPAETAAAVAGVQAEAAALGELLRDRRRAAFTWVLLPEALAVAETADALAVLEAAGVEVERLIVNRVTPPPPSPCAPCRRRRRGEAEAVAELRRDFPRLPVHLLPEQEREPRGAAALTRLWRRLAGPDGHRGLLAPRRLPGAGGEGGGEGRAGAGPVPPAAPPGWLSLLSPPGVRLLLFGGKGGVGKTTCAAAAALAAAEAGRTVLVLSTDPAHSLADVLAAPLGDDPRPVPGAPANLRAREIDAAGAFERWKRRYRRQLEGAVEALAGGGAERRVRSSGAEASFDRRVLESLLEMTPPGLDELVAVAELTAALDPAAGTDGDEGTGEEHPATAPGLLVVDTAPTGHALRLLATPALALEWDHALLSLLLKYRRLLPVGDLAPALLGLARDLRRLEALLSDRGRTRFAVVTRAGELPGSETDRLLAALEERAIAVAAVIVNAVAEPGCRRCDRRAAAHRRSVAALRRRLAAGSPPGASRPCVLGPYAILVVPAELPPPRGVETLSRWGRSWSADPG